ncbi:uncharacterized protein LOC142949879 isoform X2 [Anarhichas minor]
MKTRDKPGEVPCACRASVASHTCRVKHSSRLFSSSPSQETPEEHRLSPKYSSNSKVRNEPRKVQMPGFDLLRPFYRGDLCGLGTAKYPRMHFGTSNRKQWRRRKHTTGEMEEINTIKKTDVMAKHREYQRGWAAHPVPGEDKSIQWTAPEAPSYTKKTHPVAKYHEYQRGWDARPVPGEDKSVQWTAPKARNSTENHRTISYYVLKRFMNYQHKIVFVIRPATNLKREDMMAK